MRRVSMATRDELIRALSRRYSEVRRIERGRILDEFVAVTGYHRKHAMRVLREERTGSRQGLRPGRRVYGEAVREAIIQLWEASDRVCGKRLSAVRAFSTELTSSPGPPGPSQPRGRLRTTWRWLACCGAFGKNVVPKIFMKMNRPILMPCSMSRSRPRHVPRQANGQWQITELPISE
jgi:hypothetical protein